MDLAAKGQLVSNVRTPTYLAQLFRPTFCLESPVLLSRRPSIPDLRKLMSHSKICQSECHPLAVSFTASINGAMFTFCRCATRPECGLHRLGERCEHACLSSCHGLCLQLTAVYHQNCSCLPCVRSSARQERGQ